MADSRPRPRFSPPRQGRSRRTLERILSAAERLIGERGVDGTSVQDVVAQAGVSTGSFYARFDGRDALVHYVQNRFWEEAEGQWRAFLDPARWRGAPPAVVVGELVRILIRSHSLRTRPLRGFLLHALSAPDGKPLRRITLLDEAIADRVAELLEPSHARFGHPDAGTAVRVATRQLLATLRDAVLRGNGGVLSLPTDSEEEAAVELTRSFLRYLGDEEIPASYAELRAEVARFREQRVAG